MRIEENVKDNETLHGGEREKGREKEGILTWRASTGAISIGAISIGMVSTGTSLGPGVGCTNPGGV